MMRSVQRKRVEICVLSLAAVIAAGFAACSNDVNIMPEPSGSTSTHTSQGNTVVSSSSVVTSSSSSGGVGGADASASSSGGPLPPAKLQTADTDIAQYQSITVTVASGETAAKVIDGPFFVTDAVGGPGSNGAGIFAVVTNGDCATAQAQGTMILSYTTAPGVNYAQIHGIRLPILPGQTLCSMVGSGNTVTVLGFRPY